MHIGRSSNLRYTVLGPVPSIVIQVKNPAVKAVSQMPRQNLPEQGKPTKSNIRKKEETNQVKGQMCPPVNLECSSTCKVKYCMQFWSQFLPSIPDLDDLLIQLCRQEKNEVHAKSRQTSLSHEIRSSSTAQIKLLPDQSMQTNRCLQFVSLGCFSTAYQQFIFPT